MRAPAIGIRLAALVLAWLAGVAVQLRERPLQSSSRPAEVAVDDATCQRETARRYWHADAAPVAP